MRTILRPLAVVALAAALAGCSVGGAGSNGVMGGAPSRHMAAGNPMSGAGQGSVCPVPDDLPGITVHVALADMRMGSRMMGSAPATARMMLRAAPSVVRAGMVTFLVSNMGSRTHELVVLPLAAGQSAGSRSPSAQGKVDEKGSLGEASSSCGPGAGDGIAAGASGWISLDLAPGDYELLCNEPNHYMDGMWQQITVR